MSLCTTCPKPASITEIPDFTCPEDWGQIQKLVFQRKGNTFATVAAIELLATWTPLLAAADDTKVVVTPFVVDFITTPGDAITEGGGDNSTLNGVEEVTGVNPSQATSMIKSAPQSVIKIIKELMCEDLVVYLITGKQKIIAEDVDGTLVKGFDIQSLFAGDKQNNGFGTKDRNALNFSMKEGWSDMAIVTTPSDFNPLTDL